MDGPVVVGRKQSGRVAFVVGGPQGTHTRRHSARSSTKNRSITNRAKLRTARLLQCGSKTPQGLIDMMANSVESIGQVVNVHNSDRN